MTHTPLKQRSAREQEAAGVRLPYFVADLDGPINWHMTMLKLTMQELNNLTIYARKRAAKFNPNPLDNRNGNLDYPATQREMVDVARHILLNRSKMNLTTFAGYSQSFDNLLYRIAKKGIDVEARQLQLRRHVLMLIAATYPALTKECEYQYWLKENRT